MSAEHATIMPLAADRGALDERLPEESRDTSMLNDVVSFKENEKYETLLMVDRTPRSWYGKKHNASFVIEDAFLPDVSDKEHDLLVRIEGFPMDPRLQFLLSPSKFPSILEFRAGNISQLTHDIVEGENVRLLNFSFKSKGAITVGLLSDETTIDDEVILSIRKCMRRLSAPGLRVKFRVYFKPDEDHDEFPTPMQDVAAYKEQPWRPYCNPRSLAPKTQWGQLVKRETLKEIYEPANLTKVPVVNHFYDVHEASLKLVYAAELEYRLSIVHLHRVGRGEHTITIFQASEANVLLGAVKFGQLEEKLTPQELAGMPANIPDGTKCEVSFVDPDSKGWYKFRALTVPNVITGPGSYDVLVLIVSNEKSSKSVANALKSRNPPTKVYACSLKFQVSDACVKSQVNAVNHLCQAEINKRWHPVLLNQEYMSLGTVDVFAGLPGVEIQTAYENVYSVREWNTAQKEIFELLRKVPGQGWAFIEGIFGCGKTLVQATMAKLATDLGLHVLIVAPTNAAVHAISKTIFEKVPRLDALRIVYASAKDADTFSGEEKFTEDAKLSMFQLLQSMSALHQARYDVIPEHSLEKQVEDLVASLHERGKKLLFNYKFRDLDERYDAVEMYIKHASTDFSSRRKTQSEEEREQWDLEKRIFARSTAKLQKRVVANAKLLLCTHQLASSDLIRENFATVDSHGIIIIGDEDTQSTEPAQLIPLVLLKQSHMVKANLRFGDRQQLPPFTMSARSNYNEFGPQLQRSLFDRHLRYHPPAASLNIQYRMHPLLAKFPSQYTYGARLLDGPGAENLLVDGCFSQRVVEWATKHLPEDYTPDANFSRLLGVNVLNATVDRNFVTSSRSNPTVAKAVSDLLGTVYKSAPFPTQSITIITPYNDQRALYLVMLRKLHMSTKLPFSVLPKVATVDSMQGHESDIVIVDWVNSYGDGLGFLKDDRRINIALSRARTSLIVFFSAPPKLVASNSRKSKKQKRENFEVIAHWDYLVKEDLDMRIENESESAEDEAALDDNDSNEVEGTWGEAPAGDGC